MKKHLKHILDFSVLLSSLVGLKLLTIIYTNPNIYDNLLNEFQETTIWMQLWYYLNSIAAMLIVGIIFYLVYLSIDYLINKIIKYMVDVVLNRRIRK